MAFVLTLLYIALSLLSPAVLPEALIEARPLLIIGILVILTSLSSLAKSKLDSTPDTYLLAGLLVSSALSSVATGWISSGLTTLLGFIPVLLTLYFVAINIRSPRRMKTLVTVLVTIAFIVFAQGLIAFYSGDFLSPYLLNEGVEGISLYRFRGLGVVNDPNDLAQVFVALIPLLWLRWKKGKYVGNVLLTLIPAAVLMAGVYYTHSRGGAFALVAVLLFGFKDKLGLVKSSVLASVALALVMVLNVSGGRGMSSDDGDRVTKWAIGLQLFKAHPVFGIGVGNFANFDEYYQTAHNSYVLCLAEEGILGYFCWMGLLVCAWVGLGQIVSLEKKAPAEIETEWKGGPGIPRREPLVLAKQWKTIPDLAQYASPSLTAAVALPGFVQPTKRENPYHRSSTDWNPLLEDGDLSAGIDDDLAIRYAKIMRVSLVGFLTAAFFLSRTFTITLYILLGMIVALRTLVTERHPELHLTAGLMVKRNLIAIVASVTAIYLFVRLHGGH